MRKPVSIAPEYTIDSNGILYGRTGRALRPNVTNRGYLYTTILTDHGSKTVFIHQLVAHAFVSGYHDGLIVNHKDGNKMNNNVTNLEWITPEANNMHAAYELQTNIGVRNCRARAVIAIPKQGIGHVLKFASISDAARHFGGENATKAYCDSIKTCIWRVLSGRSKSYRGFIWTYDDEQTAKNRTILKLLTILTDYINYQSYLHQVDVINAPIEQQRLERRKQREQEQKRRKQERLERRQREACRESHHRKKYPPKMGTCKRCGKPIALNTPHDYCLECSHYFQRQTEWPSRDELKQLIRTMPFVQIASRYGVSDNAIRKWCKHYNLPFKSKEIKSYPDEEWEQI